MRTRKTSRPSLTMYSSSPTAPPGGPVGHDADRLLARQRPHVQVRVERRLRPGHDLRAVEVEVDGLHAFRDLRLEALQAGDDLLGDRQERDRGRDEPGLLDLVDGRLAVRARRGDLRRRRVRLLRHLERLGEVALGVLVAVGDLQDQLVLAGIQVPSHGQRNLLPADLADRDVEPVLEVVDEAVFLDDLADDVDVVELLLSECARVELGLRDEQREVHADLVGALLREADQLRHRQARGALARVGRHVQDLVHALRLDGRRLEDPARRLHREGARSEDGGAVLERLLDGAPLVAARQVGTPARPSPCLPRSRRRRAGRPSRRSGATACTAASRRARRR